MKLLSSFFIISFSFDTLSLPTQPFSALFDSGFPVPKHSALKKTKEQVKDAKS